MQFESPAFPHSSALYVQPSAAEDWKYADRRRLQMIVPGIHLGPLSVTREPQTLDRHGITALIAVCTKSSRPFFTAKFPNKYRYEVLEVVDGSLASTFPNVKPLVDSCLAGNGKVLFYDESGNGRPAVLICSYLMEVTSMSMQDAFSFVTNKRLSITLSPHELYQLEEYKMTLSARKSIFSDPNSDTEAAHGKRRRSDEDECPGAASEYKCPRSSSTDTEHINAVIDDEMDDL